MGNTKSSHQNHHHTGSRKNSHIITPEVAHAFTELSDGKGAIQYEKFEEKFGKCSSPFLWQYLQEGDEAEMNLQQFSKHARSLVGGSTDVYVKIFQSADCLLKACFEAARICETDLDEMFLKTLKADMTSKGTSFEAIVSWKNIVCPRLCQPIQEKFLSIFYHRLKDFEIAHSDILTDVQLFILSSCLPETVYFPQSNMQAEESKRSNQWTKLYSSIHQGISTNRFEKNVFQYKGATICIFKMENGETVIVGADQEWRHSVKYFGGPQCTLFKFYPVFQQIDIPPHTLYCNFKLRSATYGIHVGRHLTVTGDMSNIHDIEVWGCAGDLALYEKQKLQMRMEMQAERNAKVPLPGKWEENPDKALLELAGFQFSTEREHKDH